MKQISICFVCLGNICRSPTAEAIMKDICIRENADWLKVCSLGTGTWELGNPPDARAIEEGRRRGLTVEGIATRLARSHVEEIDIFLVMDKRNYADVIYIIGSEHSNKVFMLGSFEDGADDNSEIQDPYYKDHTGFASCFEQISRSCEGLFKYINDNRHLLGS